MEPSSRPTDGGNRGSHPSTGGNRSQDVHAASQRDQEPPADAAQAQVVTFIANALTLKLKGNPMFYNTLPVVVIITVGSRTTRIFAIFDANICVSSSLKAAYHTVVQSPLPPIPPIPPSLPLSLTLSLSLFPPTSVRNHTTRPSWRLLQWPSCLGTQQLYSNSSGDYTK
jgi:hypothetical protein